MKTNEVIIIGAGPSGLMAAAQLLRWGIRPRIVEANAAPSLQTKAIGVQARSMEIYRQMGLENEVFARGVPAKFASMFTEKGRLGQISMAEVGAGLSPYPYMFILTQDQNEQVLNNDLKRQGIEVEWNTAFVGLEDTNDGVLVMLETPSGRETTKARYVIGADGARSSVRKALNIEFEGSTNHEHKFFVADLEAEGELIPGNLNLFMSRRYHVLALFPMVGAKRFRLVGMLPHDLVQRENLRFEDIQPKLKEMVGHRMQFNNPSWFSTYHVHHRVATQFKQGHCFLIGDAAHIHSPVGGQGMNTGLQDAYNLAWKLGLVLSGQVNERLLETYHEERYPNAMSLINTTDRAFNVLVSSHPLARFAIDWLLPRVAPHVLKFKPMQKRFFLSFSQTGLNYRQRRLSQEHLAGLVKAGDRFPWFMDNGQDVLQKISGNRLVLFALGDWQAQLLESFRSKSLEPMMIKNRAAYSSAGLSDGLYVVRPDGYIGLSTKNPDDVRTYLTQVIGFNTP